MARDVYLYWEDKEGMQKEAIGKEKGGRAVTLPPLIVLQVESKIVVGWWLFGELNAVDGKFFHVAFFY